MAKKKEKHSDILAARRKTETTRSDTTVSNVSTTRKVFEPINFILMGVGLAVLVIGYVIMSGGKQPPNEFNEEEIYSFTRITLSPILIVLGFLIEIFAILWVPNKDKNTTAP